MLYTLHFEVTHSAFLISGGIAWILLTVFCINPFVTSAFYMRKDDLNQRLN